MATACSCRFPGFPYSLKLQQESGFAARFYHAVAVVLADRLRGINRAHEYGQENDLTDDVMYDDELHSEVLESIALAGSRFEWMLERVGAKQL